MESGLKRILIISGIFILIAIIFTFFRIHNKKKSYEKQIEKLEVALQSWGAEYHSFLPTQKGDVITVPLRTLKQSGYIEERFVNPKTKMNFSNQLLMTITKKDKGYEYKIHDEDVIKDYDDINKRAPMIVLRSHFIEYTELNEPYNDKGYVALTTDGKEADEVKIEISSDGKIVSNIDTSNLATYQVTYRVSYAKEASEITKTVIVRDTEEPEIEMSRTTLKVKDVKSYDLMNGVTVKDNSKAKLKVITTGTFASIPGRYIITYKVEDPSGNQKEKKRIIHVEK